MVGDVTTSSHANDIRRYSDAISFRRRGSTLELAKHLPSIADNESHDGTVSVKSRRSTATAAAPVGSGGVLRDAACVAGQLLAAMPSVAERVTALVNTDSQGWTPLHFAAKSGVLSMLDWTLLGDEGMEDISVNARTLTGLTMLHCASWNGRAGAIAMLLGASMQEEGDSNAWQGLAKVNVSLRGRQHTELDMALMRNFIDCARLLLRAGCHTTVSLKPNNSTVQRVSQQPCTLLAPLVRRC